MSNRFFISAALLLGIAFQASAQGAPDYYIIGKQMAEKGEARKALNIWLQARSQLDEPDPRIGFAFIELVTDEGLESFYEFASYMYDWGLSGTNASDFEEALDGEVERLRPLVDNKTYRNWKNLVDENDPAIFRQINGYWAYRDATPATDYNERLIEHWQRIAYAREHFTRSRQEPYGADDRASVYVRYGSPDLKRSGNLQFSSTMATQWVYNIITAGCQFPCPPSSEVTNSFVRVAQEFHEHPEYEIWVYRDLNRGSNQNTIFMFGTEGDTGGFGLLETVEDFIPNRAFSMGDNVLPTGRTFAIANGRAPHIDNLRPGLILQLLYYNQLASTDAFFGTMLTKIENRALDQGNPVSVSLGQEMLTEAKFTLQEAELRSPRETSLDEEQMIDIPVEVHQYRLLDEDGNPALATFVESRPQKAFYFDYISNYTGAAGDSTASPSRVEQKNLGHYDLVHSVQLFNEDREPLTAGTHRPPIAVGNADKSTSILMVPHRTEGTRQVFAAELHNRDPETGYRVDTSFPQALRGLGKTEVEQPEHLEGDAGTLKMGDLVLGYGKREEQAETDELFPFTAIHDKIVPTGEDLVLHVELYNIDQDAGGIGEVTLEYELVPVNFLGWTKRQEQDFSLTLNLKTDEPYWKENLEIQTRSLAPGRYKIVLHARDLHTGQEIERELQLEVTE